MGIAWGKIMLQSLLFFIISYLDIILSWYCQYGLVIVHARVSVNGNQGE